jgi:SMC interacting uncharacterized protein involved in chromosome segregation
MNSAQTYRYLIHREEEHKQMKKEIERTCRKYAAAVLEDVANGFMTADPITAKNMQYYGSHIRGVLKQKARELRDDE